MTIKPEKTVWDNSWGKQSEVVKISSADRKFFKYLINEVNPKDKAAGITIGMIFPCENPKNMKDIPITIETTIFPIRGAPFSFKL